MKKYVIIVAGGTGKRLKSDIPKQFIEINGLPVLMHTISRFYETDKSFHIRIVLPAKQFDTWNKLCEEKKFNIPLEIKAGGESRFHSVKNGLEDLEPLSIVGIHDGVRPLVSKEVIEQCYALAEKYGAVIPVTDIHESIRELNAGGSRHVERKNFKHIQTPQVFQSQLLLEAYRQDYSPTFTDDASVVEALGYEIHLTEGNRENIKITDNLDLKIASYLLSIKA